MPNMMYEENMVVPYDFDDMEINEALADFHHESIELLERRKRQATREKIGLAILACILAICMEILIFHSLWSRGNVFKVVMIITPLLALLISYLLVDLKYKTFDLEDGFFHRDFQFAFENKLVYIFKGQFERITKIEKDWIYVIVGNYLWRVKNMLQTVSELEGKKVLLVLVRNLYDDDAPYDCVYVKQI